MTKLKSPFVFLDRDGTIVDFVHYLINQEDLKVPSHVISGLQSLVAHHFKLVIVTNQSVLSRGLASYSTVLDLTRSLLEKLRKEGITFELCLICPHSPIDNCACRKPSVSMGLYAREVLKVDFTNSFMVGDSLTDMQFGKQLGMKTILISRNTLNCDEADFIAKDMVVATRWILGIQSKALEELS